MKEVMGDKLFELFKNEKFGEIRTVTDETGFTTFIAKDVCDALGISKYRDAVSRLESYEKGCPVVVDTPGGKQSLISITESGLYSLVLLSRKPEAKEFKRWLVCEVLPQIRKYGAYMTNRTLDNISKYPEKLGELLDNLRNERRKSDALEAIRANLQIENWKLQADKKVLKDSIDRMEPAISYYNKVISLDGAYTTTQLAQGLGLQSAIQLNKILEDRKIQYK